MRATLLLSLALILPAGCGGGDEAGTTKVAAAASLTEALTACGDGVSGTKVELEFGGSDDLAAQVRQGVGIDVFAAANMKLPQALAAEGQAQAPVPFATNELVLAVPGDGSAIHSLHDLVSAGNARLAVGSTGVPVGAYTLEVIDRLPAAQAAAVRHQIRTEEPDVKGIVGKLTTGAADAGFVYRTDVTAAGGDLTAIALPAALQPTVVYGVSVVKKSAGASRFVDDLLHGGCAAALRKAGFGPPPA